MCLRDVRFDVRLSGGAGVAERVAGAGEMVGIGGREGGGGGRGHGAGAGYDDATRLRDFEAKEVDMPTRKKRAVMTVLTGAHRAKLAEIPISRRRPFLEAWKGNSLRSAVNAFCIECLGYEDIDGITNCTAPLCPLWLYRPYQKRGNGHVRE